MSPIKEFEHLRIPLESIKLATNNFGDDNYISRGGFGKVYKGELIHTKGKVIVAVKRLDPTLGQGTPEFWKEIMMLSRYRHENLVSLLGYSDEDGDSILVYEYLPNKSLDMYLSSTTLSWIQRLKICIGAARGLEYLHNPGSTTQRVLHRDIKSSNILLDENWNAKISDFGLSKLGPANQEYTFLISRVAGTLGYCDPLYVDTGFLTKESDIYSFGVVLFEVLCGRLCFANYDDDRRFLPKLAQRCYEEKKIDTIVHSDLQEQISPNCLKKFSKIAYRCLHRDRKARPPIAEVIKELETTLQDQERHDFEKEKELKSHEEVEEDWEGEMKEKEVSNVEFQSLMVDGDGDSGGDDGEDYSGDENLQIIGKGGCGEVYKTESPEGKVKTIAIKNIVQPSKEANKLTKEDTKLINKKMRQIKSEIQTVSQIRHRYLLPLLADVSRPTCHYLVHEFMKNSSLQDILQEVKEDGREFDWLARHRVALGVAVGLEYLHMSHTPRIVHQDMKPANVLLDDDVEAQIADFGLAKSIADADTHMTSSNVAGTLGFIAPEYHQTMNKCDIYSFGILLAVLVTGKLPSDEFFQWTSEMSLVKWMRNVMTSEDPKQAIDSKLMGNGYEEQMLLVLKIACFCTFDNPKERPNSKDARSMLAQIIH